MTILEVIRWAGILLAVLPVIGFITAGVRGRRPAASLGLGAGFFGFIAAYSWIVHVAGAGTHAWFGEKWAFAVLFVIGLAVLHVGFMFTRELSTQTIVVDEEDGSKRGEQSGAFPFFLATTAVAVIGLAVETLAASELVVLLRTFGII